ncbi:hypothetical protein ABGN05_27180 [Aquibium sp. LZ166]|uniref:Uncharacterized protein n=1 Tax=Aquibium pacificus TaxID=3153579 RepID=A0ABV3SSR7_9HYPH
MDWKHDPTMSGADYLALARKRARNNKVRYDLAWMLQRDHFDYGIHRAYVGELLDPQNWNANFLAQGRKPRVFIDAYRNMRGNVEVRSIGGQCGIYFQADFTPSFINHATSGAYGGYRSPGEIMWIKDFDLLRMLAIDQRDPVAKALLFGLKARLDELIAEISSVLDVVGAMPLEFEYQGKNVSKAEFVPTISQEQIDAIRIDLWGY